MIRPVLPQSSVSMSSIVLACRNGEVVDVLYVAIHKKTRYTSRDRITRLRLLAVHAVSPQTCGYGMFTFFPDNITCLL